MMIIFDFSGGLEGLLVCVYLTGIVQPLKVEFYLIRFNLVTIMVFFVGPYAGPKHI